ncbi:MAG: hypothetical protein HOC71_14800 [Candidatus Latescibacteria bacterium]|jgi:hypothetical protein|nr:hypothetical protein [Candidatus Latescibacterota bacterium]
MKKYFIIFFILLQMPFVAESQTRLIKILITSPFIEYKAYRPLSDVIAGTIISELKRTGGMEIIDREKAEQYLIDRGLAPWVESREMAFELGEALEADIVIFSTIKKQYDNFLFNIIFLEIDRDIIQRNIRGSFRVSESASAIGKVVKEKMQKLLDYIPTPSELNDPGAMLREKTVNPEKLPTSITLEDIPQIDRFGYIEQIFSYYRVFPGEIEYQKFEQQDTINKLQFREELDEELTDILNKFYVYGDFAIRHNLQAYLIKDCSMQAINILLANKIPVLYIEGILVGYSNLTPGGFCIFKTIDKRHVENYELTHRKRVAVMFIVPKIGRRMGFSKEYLEYAVGFYRDELGKTPKLVEIKDSMFDIISNSLK